MDNNVENFAQKSEYFHFTTLGFWRWFSVGGMVVFWTRTKCPVCLSDHSLIITSDGKTDSEFAGDAVCDNCNCEFASCGEYGHGVVKERQSNTGIDRQLPEHVVLRSVVS